MPEQTEPRTKKRAFSARNPAPKVRTGCYTCKTRRVKCDEAKPKCLRCIKFGVGECGYPAETSRPSDVAKLPKRGTYRPLKPASLHQPRSGLGFNDDEEYRCFYLFTNDTLANFTGAFSDNLWGRIIAQASENEPFVRDCFVAIGALERAATLPEDCPRIPCDKPKGQRGSNRAYAYALKQYGKALKSMRKALSLDQHNLRLALIACLLVFCFESYVGNQVAAITHAQSGISLLHHWRTPRLLSAGSDVHSLAPQVIEDELTQAFTRLDLQVSILLDTRELDFHQRIKNDCLTSLQNMPSTFKTLEEARIWCELLMRWNYHFRAESIAVGKSQEISMKNPPIKWEDSMDTPMGATVLHEPKEIPVALLPEYRAHVSKTQQWFRNFEPLFKTLRPDKGKVRDFIGGIMLQVQAKMSTVTLASAFFTQETGYDAFLSEFRDIVAHTALIEPLSNHTTKRLSYHFDGGFIPPLFLVATKCRDRALRREAIRMLFTAPMREGVFDSICVGHMANWTVSVEEEGIPEGEDIPDHRRLRIRRSNIDLPMRRAQLQGTQLRFPDDTEPEWKEVVLTW